MLSICLPVYNRPDMLEIQSAVWAEYPETVEIVLVDDGSTDPIRPPKRQNLKAIRILEDRLWHQHAARNLAVKEAKGDWLMMLDIDHVLPAESLRNLLNRLDHFAINRIYRFPRKDASRPGITLTPAKNIYACTKQRYQALGGYDETLCGQYGTDGEFLSRLYASGPNCLAADSPITAYRTGTPTWVRQQARGRERTPYIVPPWEYIDTRTETEVLEGLDP